MMPSWVRWAAAVLATLRATWALMYGDGPFDLLLRLRLIAGAYSYSQVRGLDGMPQPFTRAGKFVACPYCVSSLVAPIFALLVLFPTWPGDLLLAWLGVSGAAMLAIRWRPWK